MKAALLRKVSLESGLKEHQRGESTINGDEQEDCKQDNIVHKIGDIGREDHENDTVNPISPQHNKNLSYDKLQLERSSTEPISKGSSSTRMAQDDQLESAKAKMSEAREENQRLRMYLDRTIMDYKALQMQFNKIAKDGPKTSTNTCNAHGLITHEPELFSLSLGRTSSSDPEKEGKYMFPSKGKEEYDEHDNESLGIGLDSRFEVPKTRPFEHSLNPKHSKSLEVKEELARESWPPHKIMRKMERGDDDEVSQQNPGKKTRVSVRIRCDTPTMNDGCQWRKYGQKIAKGNPCPRAYYRCSITPSCPVKKQVQRCAEEMSILTMTYEGSHNHPLPIAATAMASTTSAAASMLASGSSSSGTNKPSFGLHGLNFHLSDTTSRSNQFYLPNSSTSHPTITLDLTSSSHFNKIPYIVPITSYASTNLNFSSLESNPIPVLNNNGSTQPYKNQFGSLNLGYQHHMHESTISCPPPHAQTLGPDTIAAAAKAITSDPSFQSALAAALTSIIGGGGGGDGKFGKNLEAGETFPVVNSTTTNLGSTSNADKCFSSYLDRSRSTEKSEPRSLMFMPSSLPSSSSKSKSGSPADYRGNIE